MPLEFGGRAGHTKKFGGKAEGLAVVKCDMQASAVLGEPDFDRPRRGGIRRAQGTVLFTFSIRVLPAIGPGSAWPDQIVAGITHPGAAGGECDGARLLD